MNQAEGGNVIFKFKGDSTDLNKKTNEVSNSFKGMTKSLLKATGITKAVSAGINLITSSTDKAIARIDTFNNYPKVLENFGISIDEAKNSIDRIDQSVRGLPTSLDQAVAGVQDIFMVTKDLGEAESMFKAINDSAMVFANGSTEAVKNFTYAYKQAMSAGKVSAQDFNQMNQAIPGIMDKVAEAMGITYIELKEGLSEGDISMQQFNDTLKTLDVEGGAGMKSLAEIAKTSTGGIATQITNARTAVVRGVSSMIDAVNEGLKNNGLGGIGPVITNVAKTIESGLKSLSPYITKTISILVKNLPPIFRTIKNMTPYLLTIGTIIAGWKVGKTIQGVVQGFQSARVALSLFTMQANGTTIAQGVMNGTLKASEGLVALLTGKMKLSELASAGMAKAQAVLNAVMAANPIALVILAIVALIAIFVLLWNKCEWFRNFWIDLWNGIVSHFTAAWEGLKNIFNVVISFVSNNWQSILLFLVNPFAGAFKLLYDNCEGFRNFVNGFINTVVGFFKSIPGKLVSMAQGIINVFASIPGRLLGIGRNMAQGLWNGLAGMKDWVISKVRAMGQSILNSLKKVLGIHSPSTEMAWMAKMSVVGYTDQLDRMKSQLQNAIDGTFAISPQLANSTSMHYSPNIVVNNEMNMTTDPLGQVVGSIKTFANGAKNDYNYGMGA